MQNMVTMLFLTFIFFTVQIIIHYIDQGSGGNVREVNVLGLIMTK